MGRVALAGRSALDANKGIVSSTSRTGVAFRGLLKKETTLEA